jgi:acyl carrier protein
VTTTATFDVVRDSLVETLRLHDRADAIDASTELFGSMPEFDSLAIVELIAVLEGRFGFEMDEADITAEVFETVGSLSAYVDQHRP